MTTLFWRRWAPLCTFLIALSLLVPVPWVAAPAAAAPNPEFTFEGGGWGHGVGLSQYGAYGMAKLDGEDYRTILAHYYTGTKVGRLGDDLGAAEPLWVNLEREATTLTLQSYAIGSSSSDFEISRDNQIIRMRPGATITIEASGVTVDGVPACRLQTSEGDDAIGSCTMDIEWDGTTPNPTTRFAIENVRRSYDTGAAGPCTNLDWNSIPSTIRTCSYSRGVLHVRPDNDTASFHLVIEIDVEDYLLGISEMPYYWAEPVNGANGLEALKAQVVAARSYAIHKQIARGNPEDRTDCWCNVYDTSADQRYVGWGHSGIGQAGWLGAVRSTAGEVVMHPSSTKNGVAIPAEAFYGSSSYGRTAPAAVVFGANVPYLQSVDDHWAMDPVVRNPETRWSKSYSGTDLGKILGWSGRSVVGIDVVSCSPSGAVDEFRFRDGNGSAEIVRGRTLWPLLGLRSPQITNVGAPPPATPPCGGLGEEVGGMAAASVIVDDNPSGDSLGNNDGLAQCGETVELRTAVENQLRGTQTGLAATISTSDPFLSIVHNVASAMPDLVSGRQGSNVDDWDVAIAAGAPDGHTGTLQVAVASDQGGPWVLEFEFPIGCEPPPPPSTDPAPGDPGPVSPGGIVAVELTIDDGVSGDSVGNNDGIAQCGETVELYLTVTNSTATSFDEITAGFATADPHLSLLHNVESAYPALGPAATARNSNDWDITIDRATPAGHIAALEVTFVSGPNEWILPVPLPIGCDPGPPPGPLPGTFSVSRVTIDDGVRGDSIGNNDRVAQCGETIELYVELAGLGTDRATASLSVLDDRLTLLYNTTAGYATTGGRSAENDNDWDIRIDATVPDGLIVIMALELATAGGATETASFPLVVSCPGAEPAQPIAVSSVTVDDGVRGDSVGNNDRVAQCGETIELYVLLENRGSSALDGVEATFATSDPYLTLLYNAASPYGDISANGVAENSNDWDLKISPTTPNGHTASFWVTAVTASGDRWTVAAEIPIACN